MLLYCILFSCYQTALDAKYLTIGTLFIAMTISCLKESTSECRSNVHEDFFEFLSTKFDACSKPPSKDLIIKRLMQGRNNVTGMWVEPRSFDEGSRKNDAFIFLSFFFNNIVIPILIVLHNKSYDRYVEKDF